MFFLGRKGGEFWSTSSMRILARRTKDNWVQKSGTKRRNVTKRIRVNFFFSLFRKYPHSHHTGNFRGLSGKLLHSGAGIVLWRGHFRRSNSTDKMAWQRSHDGIFVLISFMIWVIIVEKLFSSMSSTWRVCSLNCLSGGQICKWRAENHCVWLFFFRNIDLVRTLCT